jgi:membrane-associated phospholipid phosphatase
MISYLSSIDTSVLSALYAVRDPNTVLAFIWISELGSAVLVAGLAVVLALWLTLRRKFALAQGIILAVATSGIATFLVKSAVARARPPLSFWAYIESGYSFPSAHAALAVAFYGFLAFIVWHSGMSTARKRAKLIILCTLILVIGFSRLYLGVHYLSDILGGYLLGAACLWLGIKTTRMLQDR